ncbi:MAG TPA: cell division protein ZapA [Xanthobacteraceae bacterium]|nr:cell division protein ZapA [Xanthobacteraceae bacterium]
MGQITVGINGRQYRMACEDGQEEHLRRLAQDLDLRIERLRNDFGQIGDMRLTVMAALTIADELSEQGQQLRRTEDELAALQDARVVASDRAKATEAAIAAAFHSAADRIERLARALDVGRSPTVAADDLTDVASG